jgi:hypothetical protein
MVHEICVSTTKVHRSSDPDEIRDNKPTQQCDVSFLWEFASFMKPVIRSNAATLIAMSLPTLLEIYDTD